MMALRNSKEALLKSQLDRLEYKLDQLEQANSLLQAEVSSLKRRMNSHNHLPLVHVPPPTPQPPKPQIMVVMPPTQKRHAKPKIYTPEIMDKVREMLTQGMSSRDIAQTIGSTANSLRVTCHHFGISLRQARGNNQAVRQEQ